MTMAKAWSPPPPCPASHAQCVLPPSIIARLGTPKKPAALRWTAVHSSGGIFVGDWPASTKPSCLTFAASASITALSSSRAVNRASVSFCGAARRTSVTSSSYAAFSASRVAM